MRAKNRTLLLISTGLAFSIIHLTADAKDEHLQADSKIENEAARRAAQLAKAKSLGMMTDRNTIEKPIWDLWHHNLDKFLVDRIVKQVNTHEDRPQTQSCWVSYRISEHGDIDEIRIGITDQNLRKIALEEVNALKGNSLIAFPKEVENKPYVLKSTTFRYPPVPFSHLPETSGDFDGSMNQRVWGEGSKPH